MQLCSEDSSKCLTDSFFSLSYGSPVKRALRKTLFIHFNILFTCLVTQSWLYLGEDIFDGTLASINSRPESLKWFHKSLMLVWFVLSWVKEPEKMFISSIGVSVSAFFHRTIFLRGGLLARVLVSTNTMP